MFNTGTNCILYCLRRYFSGLCLLAGLITITATTATAGSLLSNDSIKSLPDGATVSMNGVIVTAVFAIDGYSPFYYVEKVNRTCGMCVIGPISVSEGYVVNIKGQLATVGGERAILCGSPDIVSYDCPRPPEIAMSNRALGGGSVYPFTPPVAGSSGANNTGLIVKTWGKVTAIDTANSTFYIDDGSAVTADGGNTGIKVYDPYAYNFPSAVGDYMIVTGISGAELPENTNTSIRMLWAAQQPNTVQSTEYGTLSGSISASGADGVQVEICGTSSKVSAVISDGATTYSNLRLPTGSVAVTASAPGFQSLTQVANISAGSNTLDFNLSPIPAYVDIAPVSKRIPADGTTPVKMYAIIRDEEGHRLGSRSISWSTDLGQVISADSATNESGEAQLVLRAPSTPGTATIKAAAGDLKGEGYVEFAGTNAPSVRVNPADKGDTLGGIIELLLQFGDAAGTNIGISRIQVTVDDSEITCTPGEINDVWWRSYRVANGSHTIKATAMDYDGDIAYSNTVTLNISNPISEFSVTPREVSSNQPVHISAKLAKPEDWRIRVTDASDTEVWSTTGSGSTVSADWPGTSNNGLYTATVSYDVSSSTMSESVSEIIAANLVQSPAALYIATEDTFPRYDETLRKLAAISQRKNQTYNVLLPEYATWARVQDVLSRPVCKYLYVSSHGTIDFPTHVYLPASKDVLYSYQWENAPDSGAADTYWQDWHVRYVQDLNRYNNPLKLAFIDASYSGNAGAYRSTNSHDINYGTYGIYSCYECDYENSWNDMAYMLGITPDAAYAGGCAYIGWYDKAWSGDWRYTGESEYGRPAFQITVWDTLANGYKFEFVRDFIKTSRSYYLTPRPDADPYRPIGHDADISPFYNWRFWGNEMNKVF